LKGGFEKAYEFAETHGVSSSGNYPYKGGSKNTCQNVIITLNLQKNPQFVSKHHISVQPNSELALENALVANTVAATMRLSKSL
jgi:hypothetical protein